MNSGNKVFFVLLASILLGTLSSCKDKSVAQLPPTPTAAETAIYPSFTPHPESTSTTPTPPQLETIIHFPPPDYAISPTPSPLPIFEGQIVIWNRTHSSNMAGKNFPSNENVQVIVTDRDGEVRSDTVFETSAAGELPIHNFEFLLADNNLITIKLAQDQVEFYYEYIYAFADPEHQRIQVFAKPYVPVNMEITNADGTYRRFEGYADEDGNFILDTSAYLTWDDHATITIGQVIHPNVEIQITQDSPLMRFPDSVESEWYVLDEGRAPDIHSIGSLGEGYVVVDLTQDGLDDLIYAGWSLGSQTLWDHVPVKVLVNDGFGNFVEGTQAVFQGQIPEVVFGHRMIVEDLNGDGLQDVFIGDNGRDDDLNEGEPNLLLLSNTQGQLYDASDHLQSKPCTSRAPAYDDAPACGSSEDQLLYEADGLAAPLPDWPHSLAAGDIDGDGDIDIFVNNISCQFCVSTQYFLINDGTGRFMANYAIVPKEIRLDRSSGHSAAQIKDLDGDMHPDLILGGDRSNASSGGMISYNSVYWNDGSGDFSDAEKTILPWMQDQLDRTNTIGEPWYAGLTSAVNLQTMDVDDDGDLDILYTLGYRGRHIQLWINHGDRTFSDETAIRFAYQPIEGVYYDRIEKIDINQDGFPDILAVNGNYPHAYAPEQIWLNDGSGKFRLLDFSVTGKLGVLIPIDADGDGGLDFLVLNCVAADDPCQVQDFSLLVNQKLLRGALPFAPAPMPTATPQAVELNPSEGDLIFRDSFDGVLDPEWTWSNSEDDQWNLTENPGVLQVHLKQVPDVYQPPPNTLIMRSIPEENFEIVTRLVFTPVRNFQKAGLVVFEDPDNYIAFLRAYVDVAGFPGNALYFDETYLSKGNTQNFATSISNPSEVYLKLRKLGDTYTAYYSEDGQDWIYIGIHESKIQPSSIGLLIGETDQPIAAEFDTFEINMIP